MSWHLEDHRRAARLASGIGLVIGAIAISSRTDPRPGSHGTHLLISIALGGLVVGLIGALLSLDAPTRRLIPFLAVMTIGALTLLWVQQRGNAGLAGAGTVLMVAAARLFRRPPLLAVITAVLFTVVAFETHRHTSLTQSVVLCVPIVAVCLMMAMFQRLRDAKCRAQDLLAELERNRDAEARAAAMAERQHLAREMHDVLAHSLSGLMLQLEGARMLVLAAPDDPRLPDIVNRAHELAKDGLAEARHAIGMLRGEQLPGPEAIGTLTGQFERHSGIPCTFAASGPARTVPPDARLAVYRVTQEALTNVVKHAHAARVEVSMTYAAEEVRLSVEDFGDRAGGGAAGGGFGGDSRGAASGGLGEAAGGGSGSAAGGGSGSAVVGSSGGGSGGAAWEPPALLPSATGPGSGYGLTGMRERAELLGGTLTAGSTGCGFRVELRVPV